MSGGGRRPNFVLVEAGMSEGYSGGYAAEGQIVMPFYIICDVSGSMTHDMPRLNEAIQKLRRSIVQNPIVDDVAHISVISFSTGARTVMPLSQMSEQPMPTLATDGGITNYGTAFRELARAIPQDAAALRTQGYRIFRPCAFFLTDGEPTDRDWLDVFRTTLTYDKNTGVGMKQYPVFIPFGFRDAQEAELRKLAYPFSTGKYYHIKTQDTEQVIALILDVIMKTVVASGTSSSTGKPTLVHAPAPTLPGVTVGDADDDWI
jgi:uncharacterized protein YegL